EASGGQGALQVGLEVPSRDQQGVEAACTQVPADAWRVATGEAVRARLPGDVLKEAVGVAAGQVDVPVERSAVARPRLLRRARPVREEDMEVDDLRQRAEERRIVLHRMRCQDGEAQLVF